MGPSQTKTVIINDNNKAFLESIKDLHIGEWLRKYSLVDLFDENKTLGD